MAQTLSNVFVAKQTNFEMLSRTLSKTPYLPQITHHFHHSTLNSQTHLNPPFSPKPHAMQATNLIISYFKMGLFKDARLLFDEMSHRDVVAWSAMISGYISCKFYSQAWVMFVDLMRDINGVEPNEFTFSSVLKACKEMKALTCGTLVHGLVLKYGLIGNSYVNNALIDMYATCCDNMENASAVFEEIDVKSAVSWTTLIAGYTHLGDGSGALHVFRKMLLEEVELSPFSLSIAIRASASVGSPVYGEQIHAAVIKHGFESNIPVMNSILDMYYKCVGLDEADKCFHGMKERDITTWNTLIAGYEKSDPYKALKLYTSMESECLIPNCFTLTSVIAAIANLAILGVGVQIHLQTVKNGLENDLELANALIDMYAKCGSIFSSRKIFDKMCVKNVVSWTCMMIGYGTHGRGKEAVDLFEQMIRAGVRPDRIVFVAVLNACSHTGLVDEGLRYFKSMVGNYDITPDQEIYGCIVDLLGRAGQVKEAYKLIESMPFKPDESVWGAFLGACKMHKFAEFGKLDLKPSFAGSFMAMSNIYANDGRWEDSAKIRKLMKGMGKKKEAGRSWIELKDGICSFVAGDKLGTDTESVYEVVDLLVLHMKEVKYSSDIQCFMHEIENGT